MSWLKRIKDYYILTKREEKELKKENPNLYREITKVIGNYNSMVKKIYKHQKDMTKKHIKEHNGITKEFIEYVKDQKHDLADHFTYHLVIDAEMNNKKKLKKMLMQYRKGNELDQQVGKEFEDYLEEVDYVKGILFKQLKKDFTDLHYNFLLNFIKVWVDFIKKALKERQIIPGTHIKKDILKNNISKKEYSKSEKQYLNDIAEFEILLKKQKANPQKINEDFWDMFEKLFRSFWI